MKTVSILFVSMFLISGIITTMAQNEMSQDKGITRLSDKELAGGWELLFNGISFEGWRGINKSSFPAAGWKIENGMISKTKEKGGDIVTEKKYGNFIVDWEWKIMTSGGNSGLKYFVNEREGDTGGYGYGLEYQILDDTDWIKDGRMQPNDYHTVGALYELYPPSPDKKPNPVGEWNNSRIVSRGSKVEHWLNGERILKCRRGSKDFNERVAKSKFKDVTGYGLFPDGHLLLQDHDSEIYFRNIKIKVIH